MVIVVRINENYVPGMSCCQIRQLAYQAWTANSLLINPNAVKCLVALAQGVVVGVFCIKAVAETLNKNGNKAVAFWLVCADNECSTELKKHVEDLYTHEPGFKYIVSFNYIDYICKCSCTNDDIPIIPIKDIPHHGPEGSEMANRTCDKFK